jgi:hypothetical protein
MDNIAFSAVKPQEIFHEWDDVPSNFKTTSGWKSHLRRVRKGEMPSASVVVTTKRKLECADHEYETSKTYALYYVDQTTEIKLTPLNRARHRFWEIFGQPSERSKYLRWTKGQREKNADGTKFWNSDVDVWGWRTYSDWFTKPKCIDHESGRDIYGVHGGKNSYYLMIDLDLHTGSMDLFLKRFQVLLDAFHGKHGCHFQVSDQDASGVHIFLFFGCKSPLKTRKRWLINQLEELDKAHPDCQFFKTKKTGQSICNLEIYPNPNKGHRLPLARSRTMLLDQPLHLKERQRKGRQDIIGYTDWLLNPNRQYMPREDVYRYVVDRLHAEMAQSSEETTANKRTNKKQKANVNHPMELRTKSNGPDDPKPKLSMRGKTRGALIGYWLRSEPQFPNLNIALLVLLKLLRAEGLDRANAAETAMRYVRELNNPSLSSRLLDGLDKIDHVIHRNIDLIWSGEVNAKLLATVERWEAIGFRVSDKSTWLVKGKTPEVVVDCEEVEFTADERKIINEELAPIVVGKKQAKKSGKQEEVTKAVAYFLRYVCCCNREIPVVALPKILSGYKINLGKHEKQREFLRKLTELEWIEVLQDYQHPAKHGFDKKRKARTYGIGEAMVSKFPSYKKKRRERIIDLYTVVPFLRDDGSEMEIPCFGEQMEEVLTCKTMKMGLPEAQDNGRLVIDCGGNDQWSQIYGQYSSIDK